MLTVLRATRHSKISSKRTLAMAMIPLAFLAVWLKSPWETVSAIIVGGVVPLMKKEPIETKESAPKE